MLFSSILLDIILLLFIKVIDETEFGFISFLIFFQELKFPNCSFLEEKMKKGFGMTLALTPTLSLLAGGCHDGVSEICVACPLSKPEITKSHICAILPGLAPKLAKSPFLTRSISIICGSFRAFAMRLFDAARRQKTSAPLFYFFSNKEITP